MNWIRIASETDVSNGRLVVKQGSLQILLLKADSRWYAIDNRCPHEGYPLAEGTLDEQCQLTCNQNMLLWK